MLQSQKFRTGVAVAGAAAALALIPGSASAAFDAGHATQCASAGSIAGVGASFQRSAQLAWGATLLAPNPGAAQATGFGYFSAANGGCAQFAIGAAGAQTVSYEPKGSGDGRNAFGATGGVRDTRYAFGGADEPHNAAQLAVANQGPSAGTADDAVLHTIPVAQSSVAVDVKLPAGCTVTNTSGARQITRTALEGVFAAKAGYTTWGAVLPSISGTGCSAKPIQRVARKDSSGTTFAFKKYLAAINPTGDFQLDANGAPVLGNTVWPNDSGATAVVRGTENGAGSQLDALNALPDGGIAYADLATSRAKTFDWSGATESTFWTYVERADGGFTSPAVNNNSTATGAARGSNCATASYTNGGAALPATTGSWSKVDATTTTTGYAICALTYGLAWERPSLANVGSVQTPITQDQARAAKDYLGFNINATGGQTQLAAAGYAALPAAVRNIAQTGVSALNW